MRLAAALLALVTIASASQTTPASGEFLEAVEFPYYLYPPSLWERELVWLKTIGVRTVEFSIPWNWHEPERGKFDFTGQTSPRRDLRGFIRLLRRLQMRAWIRPLPPVKGWIREGYPPWVPPEPAAAEPWLRELQKILETQTETHGGPVAFSEPAVSGLDLTEPPAPLTRVSAADATALAHSRMALHAGAGTLLWQGVEWALYPVGWEAPGEPIVRKGAVSLAGDEQPAVAALRRNAALLRHWEPLLPELQTAPPRPVRLMTGTFPKGVTAVQRMTQGSTMASAVSIVNRSNAPFRGDLRVFYAPAKRYLALPPVVVNPGGALWLPVAVSLANSGLCQECSNFSKAEHIVYATAELQALEFENGILAMEFAAPEPAEVVLQLSRQPSGPYLAGGHPAKFDWDEKNFRVRLDIPQGKGPGHRIRIGLAIEPPESSAFFVNAKRLIIGQRNQISTSYSSPELAVRSRLLLPEGYSARRIEKSPTEIDYEVDVPAEALHGDWTDFAIEADGMPMGRAHLQLFRPASVRFPDALARHVGAEEVRVEPPVIPMDARNGRDVNITMRNNYPAIQTFHIVAAGERFRFLPPRLDLSMGAVMERAAELRVFPEEAGTGLRDWRIAISGAAEVKQPMRFVLVPRTGTITYSADLDQDGLPEWILENQKVRAVFSSEDGGRWLEFVWKGSDLNVLPENGALAASGSTHVRAIDGGLEFTRQNWTRTVRLSEGRLTVEQTDPLPSEVLKSAKVNEIQLDVARESATRVTYTLGR